MRREKLFIDTGAWIALLDTDDQYHAHAVGFYRELPLSVQRLTSSHVLSETYTWLRYKIGYRHAAEFLAIIRKAAAVDSLHILLEDSQLLASAEHMLGKYPDQKLSYADAVSMAFMSREGIARVFGFDRHFALPGFEVVPAIT